MFTVTDRSEETKSGRSGVTLVELLLGIFLTGIVLTGLVKVYADGIEIWRRTEAKLAMGHELSGAVQILEREIRQGQYLRVVNYHGGRGNQLKIYTSGESGPCNSDESASFYFHPFDKCIYRDKQGEYLRKRLIPVRGGKFSEDRHQIEVVNLEFEVPEGAYRKSVCNQSRDYLVDFEITVINRFEDSLSIRSSACCRGD
jgi:type II secretory pathway component PulJ